MLLNTFLACSLCFVIVASASSAFQQVDAAAARDEAGSSKIAFRGGPTFLQYHGGSANGGDPHGYKAKDDPAYSDPNLPANKAPGPYNDGDAYGGKAKGHNPLDPNAPY